MPNEIITETIGQIGVCRLNRPDKLNALNIPLMIQLVEALEAFDVDENIRCMLITGNERAFAAGADIGEMAEASMVEMYTRNQFARWERIKRVQKPIVAAVSGYVLGGGCELMMNCDIIVAAEGTQFGQPEINIGVIPGAGGTQRMTRAIGKARAMDLILTGRFIDAAAALQMGLISRVVPQEHFLDAAIKLCQELCTKPPLALRLGKEAILKNFEMPLNEGLEYERKLFYMLFGTEDQKEGMRAFVEKRKAAFEGR
ncbi:MAG: enoyl-CoA hydratase-related protein [Phycisphaerae bacterium]